jgi:hypothetical protein
MFVFNGKSPALLTPKIYFTAIAKFPSLQIFLRCKFEVLVEAFAFFRCEFTKFLGKFMELVMPIRSIRQSPIRLLYMIIGRKFDRH